MEHRTCAHAHTRPHPLQWKQIPQNYRSGGERKKKSLLMLTPSKLTKSIKMPPPFLFPVFLTGRSSTPELQNSRVNFDPTWGEHIRHWKWRPQQQAGRHQHLQFSVWESDPSPFPCFFGPHLNETCSLPSNLFSSFLSCFQVSWFVFPGVWFCIVVLNSFLWPIYFIMKFC